MNRYILFWRYLINNLLSNASLINQDSEAVVSLTSHSKRISQVFAAIESIGAGDVRPKKIYLFLDHALKNQALPIRLQRLCKRGLEIVFCEDVGPHTKYFPYLFFQKNFDVPLVTADDDIMYPSTWLAHLIDAWKSQPKIIHCYRAKEIKLAESKLVPYREWKACKNNHASAKNFATGVSGVIYPVEFQESLKQAGDSFLNCCPKADDIWLHIIAIRTGVKVRQISPKGRHFPVVPNSSHTGLIKKNLDQGQNDVQIANSYTAQDIALINSD